MYHQAEAELGRYESARERSASLSSSLRFAREELSDDEAELIADARAENPDMSATAFDRHLKVLLQQHPDLRTRRREIHRLQAELDLAERDVKVADRRLDVTVGRLHELAGLLAFYAARSPRHP